MSRALIRCPNTDRSVYVGLDYEWLTIEGADLGEQTVKCPACREEHRWTKRDIFLESAGAG